MRPQRAWSKFLAPQDALNVDLVDTPVVSVAEAASRRFDAIELDKK